MIFFALKTAIDWHAQATGLDSIEEYMSKHQHDADAGELWHYFQNVIAWIKATFPTKRKEMKNVKWGPLFKTFGTKRLNPTKLETEVARLMEDEDVERKSGIYLYVLDNDERHLNIRAFSRNMRREACEKQKGKCPKCTGANKKKWALDEMEADHIKPWREGGPTTAENCQMLCKDCNRRKAGK